MTIWGHTTSTKMVLLSNSGYQIMHFGKHIESIIHVKRNCYELRIVSPIYNNRVTTYICY